MPCNPQGALPGRLIKVDCATEVACEVCCAAVSVQPAAERSACWAATHTHHRFEVTDRSNLWALAS